MPWKVTKTSGAKPFKVVNEQTGAVKGSHPTRENAVAQLRALYANVPEARTPKKSSRK